MIGADNASLCRIQTYTGKAFYPLLPKSEDICIEDIAHALSMQCRFTGHCTELYSVAEHSVYVSENVPPEFAFWGLLHDASEAYLHDLASPLKRYTDLGARYSEIEDKLMYVICKHFGLQLQEPEEVKIADRRMLHTERRDLMVPTNGIFEEGDPYPFHVISWSPKYAEEMFLSRFSELTY